MSLSPHEVERDVVRLRMRSWRGAMVGYDVSAYLVGDVLVDTGFPRAASELLAVVESARPRGVVLTHWHEDHAGNAPTIAERGVPMVMDAGCETRLRERPPIRFYRRVVWGWTKRLTSHVERFDPSPLETIPATPGRLIRRGSALTRTGAPKTSARRPQSASGT